jgi:hypothetical protein
MSENETETTPSLPSAPVQPRTFYDRVLKLHQNALSKGFEGPAALFCASLTSASMLAIDWCVMMYYILDEKCRKRNAVKNEPKNE